MYTLNFSNCLAKQLKNLAYFSKFLDVIFCMYILKLDDQSGFELMSIDSVDYLMSID